MSLFLKLDIWDPCLFSLLILLILSSWASPIMGLCIITCFMFLCLLNPHHSTTLLAHPSNPPSTCFHHFPMCMRSKMHGHPHLIILLTDIPVTTLFSLYIHISTRHLHYKHHTHATLTFISLKHTPLPIFHSCTQESCSHHHTCVRTTHLILHNLPCIPHSFIFAIPHICMKLHASMQAMQTWPPLHTHFSLHTTCPFFQMPMRPISPTSTHFQLIPTLFSREWSPMHGYPSHPTAPLLVSHSCKGTCMHDHFHFFHTPQARKKGQGEWTQTIKGVGVENPHIFLLFLSLEICFSKKKKGYKSPHWCWVKLGFIAMCFKRSFTCPQICLLWSWYIR